MSPLADLRVVELATGVAGPYAGKLFAGYGADVVKVEPPGGDPARAAVVEPADADDPDLETGPLHLHLNLNKRSVVADVATPEGADLVRRLAARADLVIESGRPGELDALGLGPAALRDANPALVVLSVTPFGQDGPYAALAGEEIVAYAMGGPMAATGVAERSPTWLGAHQAQHQCGNVAALAGLAAVLRARASGRGAHVDVSNFETQAGTIDRRTTYLLWQAWTGENAPRPATHRISATPQGVYPAAEGYVLVSTITQWIDRMAAALGDEELAARVSAPDWLLDPDLPELVEAALYGWLLARPKQQAADEAQAHRWAITPLNQPAEVLADPHFAARGSFVELDHPRAGRYRTLGAPFRMTDGWALRRPAPLLGQHTAEVLAELTASVAPTGPAAPIGRGEPDALPLAGLRVLDLTVVWAGPFVTLLLGDLGAEVIRVDNPWVFPTATRGLMPRPPRELLRALGPLAGGYPNLEPGARPWNRQGMFLAHARGKLGATVDLRSAEGRELFLRLVERSDVLAENNTARVLDKLGLDWGALHARNPRLIVLRMPALGLSGPYRDWLGFGPNFEALCGLTAVRGYADADYLSSPPVYHMDAATGPAGAFAVLCALRRREETGEGCLIELAQAENMMQHIGEHFVDAARTGRRRAPAGNRHPSRAPQGCYPCAGEDRWCVISVGDDAQWEGLRRAMGSPEWAAQARFADAAGRRRAQDELDQRLAEWTAGLDRYEVFRRCQAEGVPAGPVLDEEAGYADPGLAARRFYRRNASPDAGEWTFPGHLWRWDGPPLAWGPLSQLGADNEYVWREVVGVSDDEWAAMGRAGHLSTEYLAPDGTPY